jgi:hypothetical protein
LRKGRAGTQGKCKRGAGHCDAHLKSSHFICSLCEPG